jgi:hypothetical protein
MVSSLRHIAASTLMPVMLFSIVWAVVECAGWDQSPLTRMACCAVAHHAAAETANADDCCARAEQHQQQCTQASSIVLPVTLPIVNAIFAATPDIGISAFRRAHAFEALLLRLPSEPRYLRTSVLLI